MPEDSQDQPESLSERERSFYNRKGVTRYHLIRRWIWRALGEFRRNGELRDLYDPAGCSVLDYGCGPGYNAIPLLDAGATYVTGIDISDGEIEQARAHALDHGLEQRTSYFVEDAHATDFDDDSFDLIVGQAILHHLELDRALAEIRRILRPGGRAVFLEPLAHNPILRVGRWLTPSARTPDEHPLTVADWELCTDIFDDFEHVEKELLTIPLMPLNLVVPRRVQRWAAPRIWNIDDRVLHRFPQLRRYARSTFLILK